MKVILKLLALLLLISCKSSSEDLRLRELLVEDMNRETMLLDFSKDFAELRNDIAKKHQVDLCDTTLAFKSLITLKNDDSILVNLSISDICYPVTPSWGVIEILVKSREEIRVGLEYTSMDSVHYFVLDELNRKIHGQQLDEDVFFILEWRDASQNTISEVIDKSFSALQQFIAEETLEIYGMNIHALDEKHFLKLKKNFHFELILSQVKPDVPIDIRN